MIGGCEIPVLCDVPLSQHCQPLLGLRHIQTSQASPRPFQIPVLSKISGNLNSLPFPFLQQIVWGSPSFFAAS
jgi:hypothetical protein